MATLNLSPVRYERWLKIVFDHPAPSTDEESNEDFNWQRGIEFFISDTQLLLSHFTRMCREFVVVSKRFTLPQLNQGIWFILFSEVEMGKLLADETIPLKERLDCVHSMLIPFRDFVAQCEVEELENCFWMWWDLLLTFFWSEHLWRLKGDDLMEAMYADDYGTSGHNIEISFDDLPSEAQALLDAMLETLIAIAELQDERAMSYGLHGLGHLRHPKGSAWLQRFIDENRTEFDDDGLKWLEQCRDGTVM
ncbi:hypothetical protein EON83_04010 [bacterium]|nr:MAG: hypothetical protein EON83_04010 [bacterium]